MPPSEAQKKAANKYNMEHMATLGCKVKKEEAAAFKEYSSRQGKTANTVLKEYVIECIEKDRFKQEHQPGDIMEYVPDEEPKDGE